MLNSYPKRRSELGCWSPRMRIENSELNISRIFSPRLLSEIRVCDTNFSARNRRHRRGYGRDASAAPTSARDLPPASTADREVHRPVMVDPLRYVLCPAYFSRTPEHRACAE